ncbi:hypothetical protein WN48_09853 [Eufriesea mexicana]|nr:hypothetical protein WN48_09853 [Eufriesea mexicana]
MFNLILERGVSLLKSQLDSGEEPRMVVSEDMQVLLPAIKRAQRKSVLGNVQAGDVCAVNPAGDVA